MYKLNQINIPLGFGLLFELSPNFNLRLEYINRILFTDYLDDVHGRYIDPSLFSKYLSGSNLANALILNNRVRADAVPNLTTARPGEIRGNPLNKDSYFTINLKIGYVFGRNGSSFGGSGGASERNLRRLHKHQRECPRLF
jgi:hypothetical protein